MKNFFNLRLIVLFAFLLNSCQSTPLLRQIASSGDERASTAYYETKVQQEFLEDQEKYQKQIASLYNEDTPLRKTNMYSVDPMLKVKITELKNRAAQAQYNLTRTRKASNIPEAETYSFNMAWREHHDEFILHEIEDYSLLNGEIQKQMVLSTDTTKRFYLQLNNKALSWNNKVISSSIQMGQTQEQPSLKARLVCNQEVIHHRFIGNETVGKNKNYNFDWYDTGKNGPPAIIEITRPDTECELYFRKKEETKEYGVRFVSEAEQMASIASPNLNYELCYFPSNKNLSGIDRFFTESQNSHMTCPQKIEHFQTLEVASDGLKAKIKALTGKELSDDYIKGRDPFVPLDYTNAPKLNAIFISYLVFRSDFTGNVLLQALKYHAARGAIIRIAVSDVISLGKDRQQLLDFQDAYPNVKLIFYKYKIRNLGLGDKFDELHRTNHIKLFLTYSETQPENNIIIFGGRNIHDGFLFDQPNANYIYPTLVDYRPGGDESWAHWEDFETLFQSTSLVKTIMGQFFSALNADYATVFTRSYTENIQIPSDIDPQYLNLKDNEVLLRSFVSIPFKDDMALEDLYVKMIDSAQSEIKVSTPYFHLTQKLLDAFSRASDRGVQIQLITRLEMKGDTADIILGEVNKTSINILYKKMKIYEYTTVGKILHSKLFLVDGKFVLMGSVNLNKRSFYHDIENSTLVYGPGFNRKISALYETYKKESRLLTEKQKTVFWKKFIIKAFETEL